MEINLSSPQGADQLKARAALMQVLDPELFVNIIDLGLVYDVQFLERRIIEVTMTLSTPHCPLGDAIEEGVNNALLQVFPKHKVKINIVWEPEWNFDKISPEGKEQLGLS